MPSNAMPIPMPSNALQCHTHAHTHVLAHALQCHACPPMPCPPMPCPPMQMPIPMPIPMPSLPMPESTIRGNYITRIHCSTLRRHTFNIGNYIRYYRPDNPGPSPGPGPGPNSGANPDEDILRVYKRSDGYEVRIV
ncbi:hypothetical protein QBC45DRAFT_433186 [Copromyces sp. CBS 386.78]|nr:hypothetical protein QBC45DRAFT_433186 [Copromyces sp. CBS 386.78]